MKKLLIITALSLSLVGCGEPQSNSDRVTRQAAEHQAKGNALIDKVFLVTLKDGTRCAIYEYVKSGGISCDWANSPGIVPDIPAEAPTPDLAPVQ